MDILRIEPANRVYYEELLPPELQSLLYREELTPFGLLQETPEGAEAAGLLILREEAESFDVYWLAVAEEYRGCGYGDRLLRVAFKLAADNRKKVRFWSRVLIKETKNTKVPEGYTLDGYLADRGFLPVPGESAEVLLYLDELKKKTLAAKDVLNPSIKPFSKLPEEVLKKVKKRIEKIFGSEAAATQDLRTSLVFLEDGKLRCAVLVRKVASTYYPLEFFHGDREIPEEIRQTLFSAVLTEAFNDSEGDGLISLTLREGDPLSEMMRLFKIRTRIVTRLYEASFDAAERMTQRFFEEERIRSEADQNRDEIPERLRVTGVEYFNS